MPSGAEWIGTTMNSRSKGTTVLSVWELCKVTPCQEVLEKHSQLRHDLEDPKYNYDEKESLLYESYQGIREMFEAKQEARQVNLEELSEVMNRKILQVVGAASR